jgi:hypothetical protein
MLGRTASTRDFFFQDYKGVYFPLLLRKYVSVASHASAVQNTPTDLSTSAVLTAQVTSVLANATHSVDSGAVINSRVRCNSVLFP